MSNIPDSFSLQYSAEQIRSQVVRLGGDISEWASRVWEESSADLLTIPVLRGGIFFFVDLVREISTSVEIAPTLAWAYERGQNASQRSEISLNVDDVPAKGRSLLLVDDICDSGKTLAALSLALLDAGAKEVRSAVLIRRQISNPAYDPKWIGFEYSGPEWFAGYGMDDKNRWRNLPDIFTLQPEGV